MLTQINNIFSNSLLVNETPVETGQNSWTIKWNPNIGPLFNEDKGSALIVPEALLEKTYPDLIPLFNEIKYGDLLKIFVDAEDENVQKIIAQKADYLPGLTVTTPETETTPGVYDSTPVMYYKVEIEQDKNLGHTHVFHKVDY